ncbi:ABC transporter permease [Halobacillus halophilus]|uniref:ABC transporter permease n=1 Tax=Halobacillus halophilus TaxID=1570 RepID=UPI00137158B2|nr:ABC transporter permease [Halobacillus halophilus]MYL30760.1 ABC transporter permease [Halobacillus halophilus]
MNNSQTGFKQHADFVFTLAKRELKSKYQQSLLGKLWVIIEPLGLMIVLSIAFSLLVPLPSEGFPYPAFLFVALVPWLFFNNAVNASSRTIIGNAGLIRQRNFYRPALVLVKLLSETFNFFITLIALALVLLFFQIPLGFNALYVIPIFLIQFMMMLGLMLFLSSVNAYVRDFGLVAPIMLRMGRYLSPIMYSYQAIPTQYKPYMALNPLTGLFDGYRQAVLHNSAPDFLLLSFSLIFALVVLVVGWVTFTKLQKNFADVV